MSKDFSHDPNIFLLGNIHSWILLFLGNKIPLILLLGGPSLFLNQREFGSLRESHFPVASISCDGFLQLNEKNFTTLFLTTWVYADENYFLYYMFCDSPPACTFKILFKGITFVIFKRFCFSNFKTNTCSM